MLRFLLLGLVVSVFLSFPSVRADDELTEQEVLEAVERALDGQLRDTEVRGAGDSDSEEFDCEGNPECENCFANCESEEDCAVLCAVLFGQNNEDKRGSVMTRGWIRRVRNPFRNIRWPRIPRIPHIPIRLGRIK
ncbi:hypothetical protein MAR_030498 [Mya arenaria]|uniref:Uncharacterized protein n=1 Tax=Mya arenaria TaxID=6604 RepID=A0ABY7F518_MYAAR|nr:uncharacterized protein LOC128204127 [Mya arenaria]XP_052765366.1 uncharacterized protein LOC128206739 [Mya arenaria]WAR15904.1 hypothetical protein MAR_030498 [Mya arenaria]